MFPMSKKVSLFIVTVTISFVATAGESNKLFSGSTYSYTDSDGLVSTITAKTEESAQHLYEITNADAGYSCKTIINFKDRVTIPPGYNQKDFLKRELTSCEWIVNLCGFPKCNLNNAKLPPASYQQKSRSELCVVYKANGGNGEAAPRCFKYVTSTHDVLKPVARDGVQIIPPP